MCRQAGFVLIALLALLMLVGSAALLSQLEWAGERARIARDQRTSETLAETGAALVAYAVTNVNAPGRLPFPDRGSDGNFDGYSDCVNVGTTVDASHLLGRLPHKGEEKLSSGCASEQTWTLATDLVDSDGERLWYAVSPYLLFNGKSYSGVAGSGLNTGLLDTPGGAPWLTVRAADGSVISDRVAVVIIAPGAALSGQSGRNATIPPSTDYLDSVMVGGATYSNADNDLDFIVYPHSDTTPRADCASALVPNVPASCDLFNDRVAYITIDELMPKVERRVLGDVAGLLTDYRAQFFRYPWLSPVADSLASGDYTGVPGTRAGYLAYIDMAIPESYTFYTGLTATWTRGDASITVNDGTSIVDGGGTVLVFPETTVMDTQNQAAFDALSTVTVPMPTVAPPPTSGAQCSWNGSASDVQCDYTLTQGNIYQVTICADQIPATGALPECTAVLPQQATRSIQLSLNYTGTATTQATPDGGRGRDVDSGATLVTASATTVTVTDSVAVPAFSVFGVAVGPLNLSIQRELRAEAGDTANFVTTGIYYESRAGLLGPGEPGDLPNWLVEEQWAPYIYVSYAPNLLPAGSGNCTPGVDCLSLTLAGATPVTENDIEALAVSAGAAVAANAARVPLTGASEASFFEDQNASTGDDLFDGKPRSLTFNDQTRIIAP